MVLLCACIVSILAAAGGVIWLVFRTGLVEGVIMFFKHMMEHYLAEKEEKRTKEYCDTLARYCEERAQKEIAEGESYENCLLRIRREVRAQIGKNVFAMSPDLDPHPHEGEFD